MADGTVPPPQVDRLHALGAWLAVNGQAIFGGTRPWTRVEGTTGDGTPVRFTASRDGSHVHAAVLGPLSLGEITLVGVGPAAGGVRLLGSADALEATLDGSDLHIVLPGTPPAQPVSVFELVTATS